jgi:hypothetical protein
MKINTECSFLKPEMIEKIEKQYNAKYVLESCIKGSSGEWCNFPAAIFYTEEEHSHGSNYFAMYIHPHRGGLMISNGFTASVPTYTGALVEDEVIYSRYRWDYRQKNDVVVDGGRDYFNTTAHPDDWVQFKIVKDKLEIIEKINFGDFIEGA